MSQITDARRLATRRSLPAHPPGGKLWRHIVGIASVLFTFKDPYHIYLPATVTGSHCDGNGNTVLEVEACNYRDVDRITQGSTPEGNRSFVHTHIGHNRWEVSVIDWNPPALKGIPPNAESTNLGGEEVRDVRI